MSGETKRVILAGLAALLLSADAVATFFLLLGHTEAPTATNGVVLHLCAGCVEQTDGRVSKLLDQSGNGTDVSANAGSGDTFGAILNSRALNSRDTLSITNRGFRLGPVDAISLNPSASGLTVFLVASVPHNTINRILRKQGGSVNDAGYSLLIRNDSIEAWVAQDVGNRRSQIYATSAADFFVLSMVIDTVNNTLSGYYDENGFSPGVAVGTLEELSNSNDFDIGDGLDGMQFAELIIYDRALSEEQREEVAGQLGSKYGITPKGTVSVVENGDLADVRFWQSEWLENVSGGLLNTNEANVLYADCYVGSGDFRIDATLAIDSLCATNSAGFVMNEHNIFGFSGEQGRMYTKGRMWGRQLLSTIATNLITEGEEFDFVLERKGNRLSISIDNIPVYETDFPWRWGGELGFRCLRVIDFSVTAHLLTTEQYVYDSPTYGRDNGPIEIAPVILPEGAALVDNNWHLGWPVATKVGNALIVAYQRAQHHDGSSRPEYGSASAAVVVRSVDGGQTWSPPFDLETIIQTPAVNIPGGMRAIGTSSRGTVVLIGHKGAFRSSDQGETWTHYPNAFEEFAEDGVVGYNLGPKIIQTVDGRLLAFAHVQLSGSRWEDWVLCWESGDDGCSWTYSRWFIPDEYHPVEPATFLLNDTIYMLGRYHDLEKSFNPDEKLYSMVQLTMPIDEVSYFPKAQISNIHSPYALDLMPQLAEAGKDIALGTFWSQDTADVAYNPVSRRIEAVVANRTGGGSGQGQDITKQTLNLWSIESADYRAGDVPWRFEATLLERDIMDVTKLVDGMNPGAAVIDPEAGVQHIFVYMGYYHGPAGLFRVTRPLDTSSVTNWWNSVKQEKTEMQMEEERAYFSSRGKAFVQDPASPELIADGLILQLDGSSVDEESGRGVAWHDLSGSGYTLQIPDNSLGPVVVDQGLNGLPVMRFAKSESTQWKLDAASAFAFNPGSEGMTFVIVCKPQKFEDQWQRLIHKGNTQWSGHEGYSINVVSLPGGYGRLLTRASTDMGEVIGTQSYIMDNPVDMGFSIYSVVLHDGEGLTGYFNDQVYLSGEGGVAFGSQGPFSGSMAPVEDFGIGTDLDGEIAEVLVYDRALALDELNRVNVYLKQKYALDFSEIIKVD